LLSPSKYNIKAALFEFHGRQGLPNYVGADPVRSDSQFFDHKDYFLIVTLASKNIICYNKHWGDSGIFKHTMK
jgi:hypothetical protein